MRTIYILVCTTHSLTVNQAHQIVCVPNTMDSQQSNVHNLRPDYTAWKHIISDNVIQKLKKEKSKVPESTWCPQEIIFLT